MKQKIKILQIIPNLNLAGAENMCTNLSLELSKNKNVDVRVVSLYSIATSLTKKLEESNIKVYYLKKHKGFDLKIFHKLGSIIDEFKPDIIHTHLYVLEYVVPTIKFFAKWKKVHIVHTVHNIAPKEVRKSLQGFQKRLFLKKMVLPVAISEQVQKSIFDLYNICYDVPIVYNGINLENCLIKENYKLNWNIVHIARFAKAKNHIKLINIFKKVVDKYPNMKLNLIGGGELVDEVKNVVNDLNLNNNVIFCGVLDDVYPYLHNADMFILTSDYEGMPMTIIEAMGTGLPILSTPVGGIPDMINDNYSGFLVDSEKDFVDTIFKLLDNNDLRKRIGQNALKNSITFSSKNMCEKYLKVYYELI